MTRENPSTGLSVIRNLANRGFDYVLAIYFDEDFSVKAAYRIDYEAVVAHACYSKQQSGHVLSIKQPLLADSRCVDVTAAIHLAEKLYYSVVPASATAG